MDKADNTSPKYGDENMGFAFLPKTIFFEEKQVFARWFTIVPV